MPYKNTEDKAAHYAANAETIKEHVRQHYHANKPTIRQRRKDLWENNREANNKRERARYARFRATVLSHYGDKCACCGESGKMFLEIDHIQDNGAAHRREIGTSAKALCGWIIRNNFPADFQILCANCNQGKKRNGGICPHKI